MTIATRNVGMSIKSVKLSGNLSVVAKQSLTTGAVQVEIQTSSVSRSTAKKKHNDEFYASFTASADTFNTTTEVLIVYSYFYKKPALFQAQRNLNNTNCNRDKSTLVGNVLAVTVKIQNTLKLNQPIILTFKKTEEMKMNVAKKKCSFWRSGLFFFTWGVYRKFCLVKKFIFISFQTRSSIFPYIYYGNLKRILVSEFSWMLRKFGLFFGNSDLPVENYQIIWYHSPPYNLSIVVLTAGYVSDIGFIGEWLQDGCWLISEDEGSIVCGCNHLTNFAILMDVSQTAHNPLSLQIITWIGCGISLVGLTLTITANLTIRYQVDVGFKGMLYSLRGDNSPRGNFLNTVSCVGQNFAIMPCHWMSEACKACKEACKHDIG